MKRFKIVLYAALGIIGLVGASASAKKYVVGTIYRLNDLGQYVEVDPGAFNNPLRQDGWTCLDSETTCTYQKIHEDEPIGPENAQKVSTGTYRLLSEL